MKKILYIYGNLPSYREDFFAELSKKLEVEGVELKVMYGYVVNKQTKQAEARNFKTQKFETKLNDLHFLRFSRMNGLLETVKQEKPDGVIFQFNQTNLTEWKILSYCKKHKIPYGIWGCNYTRDDLNGILVIMRNFIYKYIYRNASMCIPYGHLYHDFLIKLGVSKEKVVIAQNSINVEKIAEKECGLEKSYDHPITKILYVGALAPQKRIESSIEAVAQLIKDKEDIVYDIVGGGAQLDNLKHFLASFPEEVQKHIVLHGAKYGNELIPFWEQADVFLMPGTGGLGVNEAMAYSLPIISTIGDETVVDLLDGNGFLLSEMGDVKGQISAIRKFISLSSEEKKQMSSRSRELILQRASLKNMVEKHVYACKKMLGEC